MRQASKNIMIRKEIKMYLKDIVAKYSPNIKVKNNFFTIGITGNIASGKSTFAQQLKKELKLIFPDEKIEVISTDDFLFNNQYLIKKKLFNEKGWLSSYDQEKIMTFFNDLEISHQASIKGCYSQVTGDIEDECYFIDFPTILIVEGTMTLTELFSSYIDYSIYLEVDLTTNYRWFEKRSLENLKTKKEYTHLTKNRAKPLIKTIWEITNLKTFETYILPHKSCANLCVNLDSNHQISYVI